MAAETNLTNTDALGEAISIQFTSKFGFQLKKFMEALGITKKLPMGVGTALHKYAMDVQKATGGGEVAEGDVIPLDKVTRKKVDIIELDFKKRRKSTSMEAIQAHGHEIAVRQTNDAFLKSIQSDVRDDFFNDLFDSVNHADRTNNVNNDGDSLQAVIANVKANLEVTADDDVSVIVMVNPYDIADHIGKGSISSNGAFFGMTLLSGFTDVHIISSGRVPRKTVLGTIAENIVVPFVDMGGEVSKTFNFVKDETGFIGVLNDIQANRLTAETVAAHGVKLFADNVDLVTTGSIVAAENTEPEGA